MEKKLQLGYRIKSEGEEVIPVILQNVEKTLIVHPKESCLSLDYRLMEKKDCFIWIAFNFQHAYKDFHKDEEKDGYINWLGVRLLLDHGLLPGLDDAPDALLPRNEIIIFKTNKKHQPENYSWIDFIRDWPTFFLIPQYHLLSHNWGIKEVMEFSEKQFHWSKWGREEHKTRARMLFIGRALLKLYPENSEILEQTIPALPKYKTIR